MHTNTDPRFNRASAHNITQTQHAERIWNALLSSLISCINNIRMSARTTCHVCVCVYTYRHVICVLADWHPRYVILIEHTHTPGFLVHGQPSCIEPHLLAISANAHPIAYKYHPTKKWCHFAFNVRRLPEVTFRSVFSPQSLRVACCYILCARTRSRSLPQNQGHTGSSVSTAHKSYCTNRKHTSPI